MKKLNNSRSNYKIENSAVTPKMNGCQMGKVKSKKKRDPSTKTNVSRNSKKTFSSINYSKEIKRIGSEKFLSMNDFSSAKLKRIGSATSTTLPPKSKAKGSSKRKKSKKVRNTSNKRPKKYTKSIKYSSPSRFISQSYNLHPKKSMQNFKKQYLHKKTPISTVSHIRKKTITKKNKSPTMKKMKSPKLRKAVSEFDLNKDIYDRSILEAQRIPTTRQKKKVMKTEAKSRQEEINFYN